MMGVLKKMYQASATDLNRRIMYAELNEHLYVMVVAFQLQLARHYYFCLSKLTTPLKANSLNIAKIPPYTFISHLYQICLCRYEGCMSVVCVAHSLAECVCPCVWERGLFKQHYPAYELPSTCRLRSTFPLCLFFLNMASTCRNSADTHTNTPTRTASPKDV